MSLCMYYKLGTPCILTFKKKVFYEDYVCFIVWNRGGLLSAYHQYFQ